MQDLAKVMIIMGLVIAFIGAVIWLAVRYFPWLGNLPGDMRYEGENINFYLPLATMLLISLLATIILNIVLRIFRR